MLTQQQPAIQLCSESTPKIWDRATTKANIGDIIHAPFTPVMKVINKDVYTDGRVWLKVKPTSVSTLVGRSLAGFGFPITGGFNVNASKTYNSSPL